MNKRSEKTLNKIQNSFIKLINEKNYDDIVVQDILDEAKVGRATFYAHYNSKNELLLDVTANIFHLVFAFNSDKNPFYNYKVLIKTVFSNILKEGLFFQSILNEKNNAEFLDAFKMHLNWLFTSYYDNYPYKEELVPLELKKELAVNNFITVTKYWANSSYKQTPEEIADIYIIIFMR